MIIKFDATQDLIIIRSIENFPMLCHTLPPSATVDGLLGLDFFRGERFILDLHKGIIDF